ncbi:MAG: hypothetical protein SFX72_11070 [Isosphaeraceae bacterium]|nr:hypothetical protein [Isosphaeraceae bacterium]
MNDLGSRVSLTAAIFGFRSSLLTAGLILLFFGPWLWRNRWWWLWILPREWQRAIAARSEEEHRRFFRRIRLTAWAIVAVLLGSWLMLAYQVMRPDDSTVEGEPSPAPRSEADRPPTDRPPDSATFRPTRSPGDDR